MRLKEQRLWDTMKRNKPMHFGVLERIENAVGVGIPDVHCRTSTRLEPWVELKAPVTPKRSTTRLLGDEGLNTEQINWHLLHCSMGFDSFVLIRDTEKRLLLLHGSFAATINDAPFAQLAQNAWARTWPDVFAALMGIETSIGRKPKKPGLKLK